MGHMSTEVKPSVYGMNCLKNNKLTHLDDRVASLT